jgi:hypothetical protein
LTLPTTVFYTLSATLITQLLSVSECWLVSEIKQSQLSEEKDKVEQLHGIAGWGGYF